MDFLEKQAFTSFYAFQTTSETRNLCNSEANAPSLVKTSCACGLDSDDVSMLILLSGATISLCLGFFLGSSSISGLNQV